MVNVLGNVKTVKMNISGETEQECDGCRLFITPYPKGNGSEIILEGDLVLKVSHSKRHQFQLELYNATTRDDTLRLKWECSRRSCKNMTARGKRFQAYQDKKKGNREQRKNPNGGY